jgi:hypothetical protein
MINIVRIGINGPRIEKFGNVVSALDGRRDMELGNRTLILDDSDAALNKYQELMVKELKYVTTKSGMVYPLSDLVKARKSTMIVELNFSNRRFEIIKQRYNFNPKKVIMYLTDDDLNPNKLAKIL